MVGDGGEAQRRRLEFLKTFWGSRFPSPPCSSLVSLKRAVIGINDMAFFSTRDKDVLIRDEIDSKFSLLSVGAAGGQLSIAYGRGNKVVLFE